MFSDDNSCRDRYVFTGQPCREERPREGYEICAPIEVYKLGDTKKCKRGPEGAAQERRCPSEKVKTEM